MATVRSNANEVDDFHEQMKAILPRLRLYALSLTHDRDRANDLVQETVLKALAGRASFRPGTNFSGWIFRIQRNEFISSLRRQKPTVPIDTAVADSLTQRPTQENGLVMREFLRAFAQLSPGQREALVLAVVEGQPYDVIAEQVGVSIGTIKSRVSRARASLARLLLDPEDSEEAVDSAVRTIARNQREMSEDEDARTSLSA
ncbi:MAG: sigma-70 family RNA polymerase sigma factor [Reyranellaceae bacterium]